MNKLPGAPFVGSLRPVGAQNKTLISNTEKSWKWSVFGRKLEGSHSLFYCYFDRY